MVLARGDRYGELAGGKRRLVRLWKQLVHFEVVLEGLRGITGRLLKEIQQ